MPTLLAKCRFAMCSLYLCGRVASGVARCKSRANMNQTGRQYWAGQFYELHPDWTTQVSKVVRYFRDDCRPPSIKKDVDIAATSLIAYRVKGSRVPSQEYYDFVLPKSSRKLAAPYRCQCVDGSGVRVRWRVAGVHRHLWRRWVVMVMCCDFSHCFPLVQTQPHFFVEFFCFPRSLDRLQLHTWPSPELPGGQCDRALERIQCHHGAGQREVWLLHRPGVGDQLQHLHRWQFYPQEKGTPEAGQEGLNESRYSTDTYFFFFNAKKQCWTDKPCSSWHFLTESRRGWTSRCSKKITFQQFRFVEIVPWREHRNLQKFPTCFSSVAVVIYTPVRFCLYDWQKSCSFLLSLSGQGGHAYLKEWLWWAGLLSSRYCHRGV